MISPSHVAVLVPSVRKAADFFRKFDFEIGKEDLFEGEGTREIYVEYGKVNSLLLMEPTKPGSSYQRALDKRGPGIHHLAIDVLDLEKFISGLAGSGWLLHPNSIHMMKHVGTAYLARPGFPGLIEVQQKEKLQRGVPFVSQVSLPIDKSHSKLVEAIGLLEILKPSKAQELVIGGQTVPLKDLF